MESRGRKTVTFVVPVVDLDRSSGASVQRTRWLTADKALTTNVDEAVKLTFNRSSTPIDRHRIEVKVHELAGGLRDWIDLEDGIESTQKAFVGLLEGKLWPEGRPATTGQALLEQQDRIAKAWDETESPLRHGLTEMLGMRDRLRFMAAWPVLICNPPAGWESVAGNDEFDETTLSALRTAYEVAVAVSLSEPGRSSAP